MQHNLKKVISLASALIAFGSLTGGTNAATIAFTSSGGSADGNAGITLGYTFSTTTDIIVTSLGVIDVGENGLVESRAVGLWRTSDQTLLTTVTIGNGTSSSLVSGFRFEGITPVNLLSGVNYTIAAYYASSVDKLNMNSVSPDSRILVGSATVYNIGGSLSFPSSIDTNSRATANFLFSAVPEPSSALLAGLGALSLAARRRRRTS